MMKNIIFAPNGPFTFEIVQLAVQIFPSLEKLEVDFARACGQERRHDTTQLVSVRWRKVVVGASSRELKGLLFSGLRLWGPLWNQIIIEVEGMTHSFGTVLSYKNDALV